MGRCPGLVCGRAFGPQEKQVALRHVLAVVTLHHAGGDEVGEEAGMRLTRSREGAKFGMEGNRFLLFPSWLRAFV